MDMELPAQSMSIDYKPDTWLWSNIFSISVNVRHLFVPIASGWLTSETDDYDEFLYRQEYWISRPSEMRNL